MSKQTLHRYLKLIEEKKKKDFLNRLQILRNRLQCPHCSTGSGGLR